MFDEQKLLATIRFQLSAQKTVRYKSDTLLKANIYPSTTRFFGVVDQQYRGFRPNTFTDSGETWPLDSTAEFKGSTVVSSL